MLKKGGDLINKNYDLDKIKLNNKIELIKPETKLQPTEFEPKSEMTDNIYELVKDIKNLSLNKCPKEVTFEMLVKEMDCDDLQALISYKKNNKQELTDKLWNMYCTVCFTSSPFGFYLDPDTNDNSDYTAAVPSQK